MEKHLVDIEFRYLDASKDGNDYDNRSETVTIGIFDEFDDACKAGNEMLEMLESKFPLHKFPNGSYTKKDRFSLRGGCFGSKKSLITDLAYLRTPFNFYAHIKTLKINPVEDMLEKIKGANQRYKVYKLKQEMED